MTVVRGFDARITMSVDGVPVTTRLRDSMAGMGGTVFSREMRAVFGALTRPPDQGYSVSFTSPIEGMSIAEQFDHSLAEMQESFRGIDRSVFPERLAGLRLRDTTEEISARFRDAFDGIERSIAPPARRTPRMARVGTTEEMTAQLAEVFPGDDVLEPLSPAQRRRLDALLPDESYFAIDDPQLVAPFGPLSPTVECDWWRCMASGATKHHAAVVWHASVGDSPRNIGRPGTAGDRFLCYGCAADCHMQPAPSRPDHYDLLCTAEIGSPEWFSIQRMCHALAGVKVPEAWYREAENEIGGLWAPWHDGVLEGRCVGDRPQDDASAVLEAWVRWDGRMADEFGGTIGPLGLDFARALGPFRAPGPMSVVEFNFEMDSDEFLVHE